MSPVFDCTTPQGLADAIPKVADGVRGGDLVVLPTDTLYGIGADAFSPNAVRDLLAAKGRGREMPPPVLVGAVEAVDGLAIDVPGYARALIEAFWPGPLTLVLDAQPSLMWDLGDTAGTVALRMPDDEVALTLLREVGPLAVSSANRTGNPASRTVTEAAAQLGVAVPFYLDGGPVRGGLASTIVDCTKDEPVILRLGALSEDEIRAVADPVIERTRRETQEAETEAAALAAAEAAFGVDAEPRQEGAEGADVLDVEVVGVEAREAVEGAAPAEDPAARDALAVESDPAEAPDLATAPTEAAPVAETPDPAKEMHQS